tara:strand:- start:1599 stop:3410 length:1812 start_codon:yes stop_codon:yes gene_type:complete
MATPATRTPIKLARGSYSNLNSSIDDLQEGEIVYATDQDGLYVKEGSSLVSVSVGLLDEDNMATNSATQAASQQSVKAYVDANSGTTNLSNTANGTSLTVESSSGNNTALPAATTSAWGVMTDEDKTKLDGIASSANNYTHPNHSGEVTSTNDGATVIASNVVDEDNLKISNSPSDGKFLQYKDGTDELTWAVPTDTNTQLTTEAVQDIVGAMFTGNTETNIAATYEDSDGTIDLVADNDNTQLTTEQVQDIVGGMFTGNTETNITATYQDGDGTIDLVSTDTNTQLTTEEVQDIVGGMFTGNTETNISATYEDGDGTIDLVSTNTTYGVVDSSANGLAPQLPGSHGGKFLKADGSWEVPPDTNTQVAIDDTPVDGVTSEAISSNWAYDHNAATGNSAHVPAAGSSGQFLKHDGTWGTPPDTNTQRGIDDTPVDGETSESITSNWAYDHNAATGNSAHVPAAGSSGQFLKHDGTWGTPADATKMPLAGGTFTGSVTFEDAINENVFAITDATSPVLEPDNGMLQTWTLNTGSVSGTRTPSDSIAAGQSMLLMVDDGDGSDAITWPSTTWVGGSAPTLATSGYTVIELWKVASTLYAAHVGNVA